MSVLCTFNRCDVDVISDGLRPVRAMRPHSLHRAANFILLNFITLHKACVSECFRKINNFHKTLIFFVFEFVNNRATGTESDNLHVRTTSML